MSTRMTKEDWAWAIGVGLGAFGLALVLLTILYAILDVT